MTAKMIVSDLKKAIDIDPMRLAMTLMRICIGAIAALMFYLVAAAYALAFWLNPAFQTDNHAFILCGVLVICAFAQSTMAWLIDRGGFLDYDDDELHS